MKRSTGSFLDSLDLKNNLPSGLVVFLVALPLCLGIALASGVPLFSGIIAGVVGGLVVSLLSGSQLSVSGPAAGLTVIVLNAIHEFGSLNLFFLSVFIAGILQIILGLLKAGTIGNYFPSAVIKGMLAAIGIILILKQIPHAVGYDSDYEGDFYFFQMDSENTFSGIIHAINKSHPGALIISVISIALLIVWEHSLLKKLKFIPGALVVVIIGVILNTFFFTNTLLELKGEHLVTMPSFSNLKDLTNSFIFPDFSALGNVTVYKTAVTLAIIASIETLLSIEAIDRLDPYKRNTPADRELLAQGVGNMISGFLGGLPMTAVIVRGSANVGAGATSRFSSFIHGCLLLLCALFIPHVLNLIPLSSLACVLLFVGYKLTSVKVVKSMVKLGRDQYVPFIITILSIVFTDLLIGIVIGLSTGVFLILRRHLKRPYKLKRGQPAGTMVLELGEEVSFLHKASLLLMLERIPEDSSLIIDGTKAKYIDFDVLEVIKEYRNNAELKNVKIELRNIKDTYSIADMAKDGDPEPAPTIAASNPGTTV